jgi:hypothetical protein
LWGGGGLAQMADNFQKIILHMDHVSDYFIDILVPHIGCKYPAAAWLAHTFSGSGQNLCEHLSQYITPNIRQHTNV